MIPGKHTAPDADDPLARALAPPADESPGERAAREARELEAVRVSEAIDESLKAERVAERKKRMVKLLLLGQSESGPHLSLSSTPARAPAAHRSPQASPPR